MCAATSFGSFEAIAEWNYRFEGTIPQRVTDDGVGPIRNAKGFASIVTNRWAYLVAATRTPANRWREMEIIREYFIDEEAKLWTTTAATPYDPIEARGDPVRASGVALPGGLFPRQGLKREAVWLRLILSPFQLPSATIKRMDTARFLRQLVKHVPTLWDWERFNHLTTVPGNLVSSDAWSFVETPLWLPRPKSGPLSGSDPFVRVAVGLDPFGVAVGRSKRFVDLHKNWEARFEPVESPPNSEFQRRELLRLVDDMVVRPDETRGRFGKFVDIGRVNKSVVSDKKQRNDLLNSCEEAAFSLCEVLASEFFEIFIDAGKSTEGIDTSLASPRLEEIYRVLGRCTRRLSSCRSGQLLLHKWAKKAEDDADFFPNHFLLPAQDRPPVFYFKTFRSASKSIASVLSQYLSHKVAVARIATQLDVAEQILKPLAKLADIGGEADWKWFTTKFDPQVHITGIGIAGEVVRRDPLDFDWLSVEVHRTRFEKVKLESTIFEKKHAKFLEDWIAAGTIKDFGRNAALLDAKLLAGGILDVVNLALAMGAARDKLGKGGGVAAQAFGGLAAHSLNLGVTIADASIDNLGLKSSNVLKARMAFTLIRGVTSAFFFVSDVADAIKAFDNNDFNKGGALLVAAAAEAASAAAYFFMVATHGWVAGPWVLAIAGLIAAVAYISAALGEDEPLEVFLRNCEWGKVPYGDEGLTPSWAEGVAVRDWSRDFVLQQRMLLWIVGRFTVSEAFRSNPIAGVKVTLSAFVPSSRLSVMFVAELNDGERLEDKFVFSGDALPSEFPGTLHVVPQDTHSGRVTPKELIAVVTFEFLPGLPGERVVLTLMTNGRSVSPDPRSSVS